MTGTMILYTLFEITMNSFGTQLNSYLLAPQGFVLEKVHAIFQMIVREGSTIDSATCIKNRVRDDTLNEALILLISHISDLTTFTESILLACSSMPIVDRHTC